MAERTLTVSSAGVATDKLNVGGDGLILILSGSNSFVGTLTVQFSTLDLSTWVDGGIFTEETVWRIKPGNEIFMRVICDDYTSGSIVVTIYREAVKNA